MATPEQQTRDVRTSAVYAIVLVVVLSVWGTLSGWPGMQTLIVAAVTGLVAFFGNRHFARRRAQRR